MCPVEILRWQAYFPHNIILELHDIVVMSSLLCRSASRSVSAEGRQEWPLMYNKYTQLSSSRWYRSAREAHLLSTIISQKSSVAFGTGSNETGNLSPR